MLAMVHAVLSSEEPVSCSGRHYTVQIGDHECTIASLLEEVYQKAGISHLWSLVRHTAGMLQKRVEELGSVGV